MSSDFYRLRPQRSPYLKIFAIIVGAIAALVVFVILLSSTAANITIYPKSKTIATEFNAEIVPAASPGSAGGQAPTEASGDNIAGRVLSTTARGTAKITEIDRKETDKPATGTVTLHNDLDQDQPLIATTRLLSDNGVLFHLKDHVNLKAHSSVDAEVYADQPGRAGEIGPAHFTVPGLWKDWQTKIYAESSAPMTGGYGETDFVSQATLDRGMETTVGQLVTEGKSKLQNDLKSGEKILDEAINVEKLSATASIAPDSFASAFTVTAEIRLTAVVFDEAALRQIAEAKLRRELEPDQEITSLDLGSLQYSIVTYDLARKTATLAVNLEAPSTFRVDLDKIKKDKLIGRNKDEVIDYLQRVQPVGEIEVKFTPNWVTTVPAQENRIKIELAD